VQINLEIEKVTLFVLHEAQDLIKMTFHYVVCISYKSVLIFLSTYHY